MKDLTILVDMDGVLVDTIAGFNKTWQDTFPSVPFVPYEKLTDFYIERAYPEEQRDMVRSIWTKEGLFYNLKPFPGALEALEELSSRARVVEICTSPYRESKTCVQEKWDWIRDNLGEKWLKKIKIGTDKTLVYGDLLIDDKPNIHGEREPFWEQVFYTHPWNKDVFGKRRLTWENWREVLTELD